MTSSSSLTDRVFLGDPRAIARAISLIEDESPQGAALVGRIYERTGRAYIVGVTGPPGAGKSTLVERLTAEYRRAGSTVGILAVDPTSPYSGGAILGDRVRMQSHAQDPGVFIRSMATRGHLGGLARTTAEAALVLDAAGFDVIIIETVGVGQDEIEIVRTADVSIVTIVPGAGDEVQALKAGIMEIADIFVVNKADREGADHTAASVEMVLSLEMWPEGTWRPPVMRTVATAGTGVPELFAMVARFRTHSEAEARSRRIARAEWRLRELLGRTFMQHLEGQVLAEGEFAATLERIAARETDPYRAAADLLSRATDGTSGAWPVDHVGIAVQHAEPLVEMFRQLFDLATDEPENVGAHRLRFVATGAPKGASLELVEPLSESSPVGKFLGSRRQGLHHICLRVPDIGAAMAALRARGAQFIDEKPRTGAHGSQIAFLHPSSTCGILVELKES